MGKLNDKISEVLLKKMLEPNKYYSSDEIKMFREGLGVGAELVTMEDVAEVVKRRVNNLRSRVTYDTRERFGKEIDKATKLIEAIENYLEE